MKCYIFTYLYVDTTEPDDKVTVPEVDPLYDELDKGNTLDMYLDMEEHITAADFRPFPSKVVSWTQTYGNIYIAPQMIFLLLQPRPDYTHLQLKIQDV